MKKLICLILCAVVMCAAAACAAEKPGSGAQLAKQTSAEWPRNGYFTDENDNMLSITWMEDIDEPGWYVGCMLGEDFEEDSWGGTLAVDENALRGTLTTFGSRGDITVTVSPDGDGVSLAIDGGETYRFAEMDLPDAKIFVTINTEGRGMIGYEPGETVPELDPEWPYQSAQINLADAETYTFAAAPEEGSAFVKWTKNGADFSTDPVIAVLLDETADFIAVFRDENP